jgi:hypothetical protein
MEGDASYFRNLEERLSIIRPSRKLFEECTRVLPPITPGARELIETLHARGTKVRLIVQEHGTKSRSLRFPLPRQLGVCHTSLRSDGIRA